MAQNDPYNYDPSQDSALQRKYDLQRQQLSQQGQAQNQGQQNALQRKFASLGMVNSGEAINQGRLAGEATNQQVEQGNEAINSAQAGEQSQKSAQALQNTFARSERLGSQEFAAGEAQKARNFSQGQFDAQMAFQNKQQDFAESSFKKQFEEGQSEFSKTFDQNQEAQNFNEDMANKEFNKPTMLDNFFHAQGFQSPGQGGNIGGGNRYLTKSSGRSAGQIGAASLL